MRSALPLFSLLLFPVANCFTVPNLSGQKKADTAAALVDRRSLFENTAAGWAAAAGLAFLSPDAAVASGGATAGGAYLLSAKQRYNNRVKAGMKSFVGLGESLESGSLDATKAYFATDDEGGWKDSSSAGYLLANAFRRSSSTAPDSLPSVKKWKAFLGNVEAMMKALKKKDSKTVLASYKKALPALDEYLAEVDLPPALEL
eukprot:CAMPEP_0202441978 /NCGR_PEP_ID=MMETSP1360-20130828/1493_1 /ASSEMBLY_ACC=CAM_ASM_000848 /TAXON_ID=515479 /ORGANISM="Licmophora paradoxa, Strain CCMP2313" /LENGTH=201 /DNA_ID=CAMNT_0049057201 /DNA_START=14 /DNA_END=619 /DNA_ORIENTATION=+